MPDPALAAVAGSRGQGSLQPGRPTVAAGALIAFCLHAGAVMALIAVRQPVTLPEPPPEKAVEVVSLPLASSAPAMAAPLQPPLSHAAVAASSAEPVAEAAPPPEPEEPPPPLLAFAAPLIESAPVLVLEADPAIVMPPVRAAPEVAPARVPHRLAPVKAKPKRAAVADTAAAAVPEAAPTPILVPPRVGAPAAAPAAPAPGHNPAAEALFEARVRDAVQGAVRYPAAARMMALTGRTRLELGYHAGTLTGVSLAQSAGAPLLDDAAVAAAKTAHYPPPPPEIGDRPLRFLIWVNFTSS